MISGVSKTKADVGRRYDRGTYYPCINVKCYDFGDVDAIKNHFECSYDAAQQAVYWAYNHAQRIFWDDIEERAKEEIWDDRVKVYSDGRMGGWLVVHGLKDIDEWDAIDLRKWNKLEREVIALVKDLSDDADILDNIEANRWTEEGAQEYNFKDVKQEDGTYKTVCLVDLRRVEKQAVSEYIASL